MSALERAQAALDLQQFALADRHLMQAIAEDGDSGYPHLLLAFSLLRQKRWRESQGMARESLARCPNQAEAYSILVFGILQEEQYVPHPADIAAAGLSARDATPLAIARKLASLAIAYAPEEAEGYHAMSMVDWRDQKCEEARNGALRGLELDPRHRGCTFLLVLSLRDMHRLEEARSIALEWLRYRPEEGEMHWQLANLALELGYPDESTEHARVALRSDPSDARYVQTYWDTLRAQFPFLRPLVAWEFFVRRQLQPFLGVFLIGWILLLGLLDATLRGSSSPIFLPVLGPLAIFLFFEKVPLSLVDLWLARKPGFEFMLDRRHYGTRAALWGVALLLYGWTLFAAFSGRWELYQTVLGYLMLLGVIIGILGLATKMALQTDRWVLRSALGIQSLGSVALMGIGVMRIQSQRSLGIQRVDLGSIYMVLGGILLGAIGPVLLAAIFDKREPTDEKEGLSDW